MARKLISYWQGRGRKDLIFAAALVLIAGAAKHYLFPPPLTDYAKWQRRPALRVPVSASTAAAETGLPPCLFLVPRGSPSQPVASGSIGDCLLLVPDGKIANLFEVNLRTGSFIPVRTDSYVTDTIPLAFSRVYRPIDEWSNNTQIYLLDVYDPFLTGSRFPYTFMDWNLPDSQTIHYDRVSSGTDYADAVFEHGSSTPLFAWSRIAWNGFGWDLNRGDGVTYLTPEAYYATRPNQGSLVAIFDQKGGQVRLGRDVNGDLKEIQSPNGDWIRLSYSDGRISRVENRSGQHVDYEYDSYNRLRRATDSRGTEEYSFDSSNRIVMVSNSKDGVVLQNIYDPLGRVVEQSFEGKASYHIRYLTDEHGNVVGADVGGPQSEMTRIKLLDETYTIERYAPELATEK